MLEEFKDLINTRPERNKTEKQKGFAKDWENPRKRNAMTFRRVQGLYSGQIRINIFEFDAWLTYKNFDEYFNATIARLDKKAAK